MALSSIRDLTETSAPIDRLMSQHGSDDQIEYLDRLRNSTVAATSGCRTASHRHQKALNKFQANH